MKRKRNKEKDVCKDLARRWTEMTKRALLAHTLDRREFIVLFQSTYEMVKKYSVLSAIDRDRMGLVLAVGGFSATRMAAVDPMHVAAVDLANAMMCSCLCGAAQEEIVVLGSNCASAPDRLEFTRPSEALDILKGDAELFQTFTAEGMESD
jgi:hypothetical protein